VSLWIFGYGSLIWRPDFDYLERRRTRLHGWQRRFWQGSHDHRGMPELPGRVVTLVQTPDGHCDGMAYRVERHTVERVFETLDHREKNGYTRHAVDLECLEEPPESASWSASNRLPAVVRLQAVVYIAGTGNHAYLGPAPVTDMVRQIVDSAGPSGRNIDYLLDLADALRAMNADDPHVFELAEAARQYAS
jgi:glutathione-specific gamma-glutamylcyclotransferase